MRIYTRTGDSGQTNLYGGKRVLKDDLRLEALGAVDELNTALGIARAECGLKTFKKKNLDFNLILLKLQKDLLLIGSLLAGFSLPAQRLALSVKILEKWIDELEKELPELRKFILPGGTKLASQLHLARSICRRAERRVVRLSQKEKIDKSIIIYLNRLSDLLFEMARWENLQAGKKETIWKI